MVPNSKLIRKLIILSVSLNPKSLVSVLKELTLKRFIDASIFTFSLTDPLTSIEVLIKNVTKL